MPAPLPASASPRGPRDAAGQIIAFVRDHIENGDLRPGDRIGPERELVRQVGVSRNGVREGLRSLVALGVVTTRQGCGTFITAGPPTIGTESMGLLTALHGISYSGVQEVAHVLECAAAGLAAERATAQQLADLSDQVVNMYSDLDDPQAFLKHDAQFHRAVAAAANNLALGVLLEMVGPHPGDGARSGCAPLSLKEAAAAHRRIYRAIRARDCDGARAAMVEHAQVTALLEAPTPRADPFRERQT